MVLPSVLIGQSPFSHHGVEIKMQLDDGTTVFMFPHRSNPNFYIIFHTISAFLKKKMAHQRFLFLQ